MTFWDSVIIKRRMAFTYHICVGEVMTDFKKYRCTACGHIYDEAQGDSDSGIPAGTRWEDIPADWSCPICGAPKSEFKLID